MTFGCSRCEICVRVHVSNTNPHIASGSTGHHAQQTHRVRQTPHRYHSINYYFQLVSRKSSVTDKTVHVYSMSHSNYIWIGECRLGRLGGFRYSERKDSSSNWLWINMQIQEYYIKFPLLSEGRGEAVQGHFAGLACHTVCLRSGLEDTGFWGSPRNYLPDGGMIYANIEEIDREREKEGR